jgi:hypothetical protein
VSSGKHPLGSAEHEGGAVKSEEGEGRDHPPGATRRMVIAVLIVVLIVVAVAALSMSGARGHRRRATGPLPARAGLIMTGASA